MNAVKHAVFASGPRTISVDLRGTPDHVCLEVINPGTLPAGLTLEGEASTGRGGLSIIQALLPPKGATLEMTSRDGHVRMTLSLCEPVLAGDRSVAGDSC